MNKELIKEIIVKNESIITQQVQTIVKREDILLPSDNININKVILFYGIRRSGKSFLLFDLFKQHSDSSLYIDFEDERFVNINVLDLDKIREAFFELKPNLLKQKGVIFLFDEIQNIKDWEKFARRLIEKEKINFVCAGSSSKITPASIHTALRGRVWSIEVLPFSFREFLISRGFDVADRKLFYGDEKIAVKSSFNEYLTFGGFPEVVLSQSEFEKRKILKEYLNAMYFRDLVERYEIKNMSLLEALWNKLFSSFGTKFSLSSFYKQHKDSFPISKDSLFQYYKYFIESMLICEVKKFSESSYKMLRNPAKIYVTDIGLAKKVGSLDLGRSLENIVFIELKRRGYEVFYFNEKKECDFIAKRDDVFEIFQVTWDITNNNREREIQGLVAAAKNIHIKWGTIVTYDYEEKIEVENVTVNIVPAWKWLIKRDEN